MATCHEHLLTYSVYKEFFDFLYFIHYMFYIVEKKKLYVTLFLI